MKNILKKILLSTLVLGLSSAAFADHHGKKTIVEIAVADEENFSTLVAAVTAAGLVETLSGEGPFTVFAPTNEAFAKIPEETLADLLKPENKEKLVGILTYHVVSGKVMSSDVAAGEVE
ncbi:MAG: fasciclin domain-containing protein, partial [Verrucomicrobiota bacterium]